MKKIIYILLAINLFIINALAGDNEAKSESKTTNNSTLSGKIIDQNTGESLAGVAIKIEGTDLKTYTDFEGKFELKNIKPGKYNISTSYITYNKTINNYEVKIDQVNNLQVKLETIEK